MNSQTEITGHSPRTQAPKEYFSGTAWITPMAPNDEIFNCAIASVTFEPGARNHWHTHPSGQILIVTEGTGYYQEKGLPIQLIKKGDVIKIPPDLLHWHGASPLAALTHLAVNPNTEKGMVNWLEEVSDLEYNSFH